MTFTNDKSHLLIQLIPAPRLTQLTVRLWPADLQGTHPYLVHDNTNCLVLTSTTACQSEVAA
jgi:hypothetical protein